MSETELINKLATAVAERVRPAVPIDVDLWDAKMVAQFLKVEPEQVTTRYAPQTSFPAPIRLPTPTGSRGHPRWKALEIIEWAYRFQVKRKN